MSIGGFISNLFGSTNKSTATAPQVNPNAYQYGGTPAGAEEAANRYEGIGVNAQQRRGDQAAFQQANYGQADEDRARSLQARGVESQATNAMLARAMGRTPSIAQMQGDRQMRAANAAQASAAASARGAGGLALAQQNAANNTANMQSDIAGQTAIAAANERLQAEQAAAQAGAQLRGGDFNSGQMAGQRAQYDAGAMNQMGQFNANERMQQKELNDRMQLGMTQAEMGVRGMQLGASQNQQAQQSANQLGAAGINAGVGGQNAAMNQQNAYGVVGWGAQVAGGYAAGGGGGSVTGGKATGGPVTGGKPVVVGEHGPELVVPQHNATVLPTEVTMPLLARSTWGTGGQMSGEDQQLAADQASKRAEQASAAYAQAKDYKDPYTQVLARERAGRAAGLGQTADDAREERYARFMAGEAKRNAGEPDERRDTSDRADVAGGKALPKQSRLSSVLGTVGSGAQQMARVDTAYHGPTSFAGPALIPVSMPGRALGGPVAGGNPYMMGEHGPEIVVPQLGHTAAPIAGAAGPSFEQLGSGGMNPIGSLKAMSNVATQFQRNPAAPVVAGARADGGPVDAGKSYVMGEHGPEMVIDLDKPEENTIDLDARDEGDIDKPKFDQRQVYEPPTFHRDTPAEQRAVKRGYEDKAGRDADAMMASFRRALGNGPVAHVRDESGRDERVAAREDGGPLKKGQTALVGENGPEAVMPAMSEATAERLRDRGNAGGASSPPTKGYDIPAPNTGLAEAPAAIVHASPVEPRAAPVLAEQGPDEQRLAMERAAQTTSRVPMLMPLGTFLGGYFGASRGR